MFLSGVEESCGLLLAGSFPALIFVSGADCGLRHRAGNRIMTGTGSGSGDGALSGSAEGACDGDGAQAVSVPSGFGRVGLRHPSVEVPVGESPYHRGRGRIDLMYPSGYTPSMFKVRKTAA